jgi:GNAT superfamily N-acetyltransferase
MSEDNQKSIPITVYHLQMLSPDQLRPSARTIPDFKIYQADLPNPGFSRYLYQSVGGPWQWYERLTWTRDQWLSYLDRPQQETWVGYLRGTPAGYFELEHQPRDSVEIVYFGLMPDFIGRGLGGVLLTAAVRRAWELGGRRVWVHTCTLDHQYALQNYLSRGFRLFKEEKKDVVISAVPETELPNLHPPEPPVKPKSPIQDPRNEELTRV